MKTRPTKKQINFIKIICAVCELENPNCRTKEEASTWISSYIEYYKQVLNDPRFHWDLDDYAENGYDPYDYYN